jgi:hypothetical protein
MSSENNSVQEYSAEWWVAELDKVSKTLDEKWRDSADKVVARYLDDRTDDSSDAKRKYNIFWANVQILKSALYATPPKPEVRRQHGDAKDDIARTASLMLQRMLTFSLQEDNSDEHEAIQMAVEDRLIPGLGQIWVRYEVETEKVTIPAVPHPDGTQFPPLQAEQAGERITSEEVELDYVHWKDFFWSPARTWGEVWWVGRRVWMKKKTFIKRFGQEKYDELKSQMETVKRVDGYPKGFEKGRVEVFELWCQDTEKAYWIHRGAKLELDSRDDPLKLDDFFPCPKPLLGTHTTNDVTPRPDYVMCQDQYTELDDLNDRISTLTRALRVVGVFDGGNKELSSMLTGSEMRMIPVDNWAMFAQQGGIKGSVDWFPIDVVAAVLEKLMMQRQAVIAQIYELTSISDIMRGVSQSRETAKAQTLKAQYSSVRLQLNQQEVAKFVCSILRLKAEIIAKHFQPETIFKQSQVEFTESAQFAEQAVQLIKNYEASEYRIYIGEESLSLADYNAEREMRTEFLTAIGQFLSQSAQMVANMPSAMPYVAKMIQWVAASFRGSEDIETVLDEAVAEAQKNPPQGEGGDQPPPDNSLQIAQIKAQADQQLAAQQSQHDGQIEQMKLALEDKLNERDNATKKEVAELQARVQLLIAHMDTKNASIDTAAQVHMNETNNEAALEQIEAAPAPAPTSGE